MMNAQTRGFMITLSPLKVGKLTVFRVILIHHRGWTSIYQVDKGRYGPVKLLVTSKGQSFFLKDLIKCFEKIVTRQLYNSVNYKLWNGFFST